MLKNYFITAFNNLLKNKLYSVINIVGLAVGLSACILISLYVQDELSYDKHWDRAERIYRINIESDIPGSPPTRMGFVAAPVLGSMENFFPAEIESGTRLLVSDTDIRVNDFVFSEKIGLADRQIEEIFRFETITGNLIETFSAVNNIALSEELAVRLFGDVNVVGELVSTSNRDYSVVAVYRQPTDNSVLSPLPAVALLDDTVMSNALPFYNNWLANIVRAFVVLPEGVDVDRINSNLVDFINQNAAFPSSFTAVADNSPAEIIRYNLQPIGEIYLNPWDESDADSSGNKTMILVFSLIAVLVLVIGCVNFIVLTSAKSTNRAKEVAMRKVMGAKRSTLIAQFLGEAMIVTFLATLIGLVLLEILTPTFLALTAKALSLDYGAPLTYLSLAALVAIVGGIGGFYPALVLSSFKPAKTLTSGRSAESAGSVRMRDALVVFQFFVSVALIVSTVFVFFQSRFAATTNLGFNPENLIVVEGGFNRPEVVESFDLLKQELDRVEGVTNSTLSYLRPAQGIVDSMPFSMVSQGLGDDRGAMNSFSMLRYTPVDADFFPTYQIPIIAGRNYDDSFERDRLIETSEQTLEVNVIINEAGAEHLGLNSPEDALGKVLRGNLRPFGDVPLIVDYTIIGVVANTLFHNARTETAPEIYPYDRARVLNLTLRFDTSPDLVLDSVRDTWNSIVGSATLNTQFVDQILDVQFNDVRTQGGMLAGFSLLAVLLACLGLLGMSAFVIERRTKEIGLRKVMGAKVKDVVRLLVWQFSKPVLIANLLAWPFTVWAMIWWLEGFSNRIDSLWLLPLCLGAGVVSLLFMGVTVAGNTSHIARRSPIHALRYE